LLTFVAQSLSAPPAQALPFKTLKFVKKSEPKATSEKDLEPINKPAEQANPTDLTPQKLEINQKLEIKKAPVPDKKVPVLEPAEDKPAPTRAIDKKKSVPEPVDIQSEQTGAIEKHFKLGDTFFERRDFTNALLEYEAIVSLDKQNLKAHYMLGKTLMNMSDFSESSKEFDIVISLRPASADAHFMKAETLRLQGKYQEAQKRVRRQRAQQQSQCAGLRLSGRMSAAVRRLPRRNQRLQRGDQVGSQIDCSATRACTMLRSNAVIGSSSNGVQKAINVKPDDPVTYTRYGLTLGQLKRWEEAERELRTAIKADPNFSEGHVGLAWVLAKRGKRVEALHEARIAVALAPNDPDTHSSLAWVYSENGDHASAVMQYRLALNIDPKNGRLHKSLAMALKDRGDIDGAIAELFTTTKMLPHDYDARLALKEMIDKRGGQE
jgi:Flp pilus assembly protein TadD, contains TPR repeats